MPLIQMVLNFEYQVCDVDGDSNCGFYACLLGLYNIGLWKKFKLSGENGYPAMLQLRKKLVG